MALPNLDKLRGQLLISGIQQTNQPLWQVINSLITYLKSLSNQTDAAASGGGGSGSTEPYLTHQNAIATLPQSRNLLAGTNVTFDDSVFGERTVDVDLAFILDATFLTTADETADFPNSVQLLAGSGITFDDTVPNERTINATTPASGTQWTVLTNGNVDNPELVFLNGDVIMVHTP